MTTTCNLKPILAALGVALLATPALAAPPAANVYGPSATAVVENGAVIGADPDTRIRGALMREWDSLHGE